MADDASVDRGDFREMLLPDAAVRTRGVDEGASLLREIRAVRPNQLVRVRERRTAESTRQPAGKQSNNKHHERSLAVPCKHAVLQARFVIRFH